MERNNTLDTLKGVLISFVVLGHCLLWGSQKSSFANWIYIFHMPLFVFISGYLSHVNSRSFWKGVLAVVESYVVFQLIKGVLSSYAPITFLTTPASMMWYLFALIIWRVLYYFYSHITQSVPQKQKQTLNIIIEVVLIALGLAIGFFPNIGKTFALSRLIVFAPFFWLGTIAQGKDFIGVCKQIPLWSALVVLASTLALIVWITPQGWLDVRETVRGVNCYDPQNQLLGLLGRGVYYVLAFIISVALTRLVFENNLLSRIGKDSLKFYLFHGVILWFMSYFHVPWSWWLSVVYFLMIMSGLYFFNKTRLSDFAIRPVHFIRGLFETKKNRDNG